MDTEQSIRLSCRTATHAYGEVALNVRRLAGTLQRKTQFVQHMGNTLTLEMQSECADKISSLLRVQVIFETCLLELTVVSILFAAG